MCSFVSGHSVGEYSALLANNCLSLETAVDLLQTRSSLMQEACLQTDGAMAACMNIEPQLLSQILTQVAEEGKGICNIANDNSVNQIVISGHKHLVEKAISIIKQQGSKAIMLKVSGAFHSPLMLSAQTKMAQKISRTDFQDASVPIVMNVSAEPCIDSAQIKQNLAQQIVMPVKWRQIMEFAAKNNLEIVEIGAGSVLANLAKRSNYPHKVSSILDDQSLMEFIELHLA